MDDDIGSLTHAIKAVSPFYHCPNHSAMMTKIDSETKWHTLLRRLILAPCSMSKRATLSRFRDAANDNTEVPYQFQTHAC
jgi:hypothetical protein